jgi:hypothetical protein
LGALWWRFSFGASLSSDGINGEEILNRGASGRSAIVGLAAEAGQKPPVFAAQPNDQVDIDVAAFDDRGLKLLNPELHGGDLLDQRLFRLGETPAEFGAVGIEQTAVSHCRDGALIDAWQGDACLGVAGPSFGVGGGNKRHSFSSRMERAGALGWNPELKG